MKTATLTYKDLMTSLLCASFEENKNSNFYTGRKMIMNAKSMLNLDEAVLIQANNRNWEIDQLDSWVNSDEAFLAVLNWISDGGNGFATFFDNIKAVA